MQRVSLVRIVRMDPIACTHQFVLDCRESRHDVLDLNVSRLLQFVPYGNSSLVTGFNLLRLGPGKLAASLLGFFEHILDFRPNVARLFR